MALDIGTCQPGALVSLPPPRLDSRCSVESAMRRRRSVRAFGQAPLAVAEIAQLLWAAQGVTSAEGLRTAPSAGALYPLELYLVPGNVDGLGAGVYKYRPEIHRLEMQAAAVRCQDLEGIAFGQGFLKRAALVIVFAGVDTRITGKYGQRGIRYMHIEVGHAAQNVLLQAVSLGLNAVVVGAFDDRGVEVLLKIPESEQALCLLPVGRM